eukprot:TRINITY_DN4213_c0_g3_i1.p1 TRINITY_DN4213_c0_g3~~TRINITY_DN4213_c0_g3_i1.p1  ORF type:complete len:474 (-),score=66.57 TRINITY_DN4213_c0_g3_i1:86-1507(-)
MEHDNNSNNDDKEQQLQVSRLCYWWSVLIYNSMLDCSCVLRDLDTIGSLVLICKPLFKHIKPFIEDNFWFYQPEGKLLRFDWFSPKKVTGLSSLSIAQKSRKMASLFSSQSECHLPSSVTHISFSANFKDSLDNLPNTITHLYLGDFMNFNPPIENLPHSIIYIQFGAHFNRPVDGILPPNVRELIFGMGFNQPTHNLPRKLTHLTFKLYFNQPLLNLPQTLNYLKLSNYFNQELILPPNLTQLFFGQNFNFPIDLSDKIVELTFGKNYNQLIKSLPPHLKQLRFGSNFDQFIEHFPSTLVELHFGLNFQQEIDFPSNITHLSISYYSSTTFNKLPKKLTHLNILNSNQPMTHFPSLPRLTHLCFEDVYNQPFESLPLTLTHLQFGASFNYPIKTLPHTLKHLIFGANFDQQISHAFPPGLTHVTFGSDFSQVISDLPSSVSHLTFCKTYRDYYKIPTDHINPTVKIAFVENL